MKLSKLAETIPVSAPLAFNNAIKERISKGEKIYNFTIGDFDPTIFPIPQLLEDEIVKAYRNKQTNYPLAEGNPELREVLSNYIAKFQHLNYTSDEILVASGGRPIIYAAFKVIVDPGDKVIYPSPSWNNRYYTKLSSGESCAIETTEADNFTLTADAIAPHIKDAALLVLCAPQNPTGTCYSFDQMKAICDLVIEENNRRSDDEKKVYLLYDHIYNQLIHEGKHIDPVSVCPEMKTYTIYMDAISKNFCATGVRVGWGYAPKALIDKMKLVLNHSGAWAPMPEQIGVTEFLKNETETRRFLNEFKDKVQQRLHVFYNGILNLKKEGMPIDVIKPQASMYLTIKIDINEDVKDFLLEKAGIAILPLSAFGATLSDKWIRLSVGTCNMEDIEPAINQLRSALIANLQTVH